MKIPVGGPFHTTPEMHTNVQNVLNSGRLSSGPYVAAFEKKFADYVGVKHAIMCNSGTSALIVALAVLKSVDHWYNYITDVFVPATTFVATFNAVFHNSLVPIVVDVDPITYNINADLVASSMTTTAGAILPVHTFGLPANMSPLYDIATERHLRIVEDSCEALGATYDGQQVGSLGDIGCFSFYVGHHITGGSGGMVTTNNDDYAAKVRSLINHGWNRENEPVAANDFDFEKIRRRYYFTSIGYNFRATELQAAILAPQLDTIRGNLKQRVDNAKELTGGLKPFEDRLQLPSCPYDRSHSLMMYPVVMKSGDKWDLIAHLEKNGIETREMLPLVNQPCYKGLIDPDKYPVASWINENGFYIGCSHHLTVDHMGYVTEKVAEYFNA